jgi:protein arginine kinase
MTTWYAEEKGDISPIISSRVRLARNVKKYPFIMRITSEESEALVNEVTEALHFQFTLISLADKSAIEKRVLLEKHIISPEFLRMTKPKGLLLQSDEKIAVMINEEDHIRIQAIYAGDDLDNAWDLASKADDLLEERIEYAFDKEYGYLTSCPTNTGTGLRASYMAHLPMLEKTGQLKNLLTAVSKFGMTMRGLYGEGTDPMGSIYQISNQMTLGKSEDEIIHSLKTITGQIIENENRIRERAFTDAKPEMEDRVFRAYGTLAYARKLSSSEAMELLSDVRLGYLSGLLTKPKPEYTLYQIMMNIQTGALQMRAGKELNEQDRDMARADYLRSIFAE